MYKCAIYDFIRLFIDVMIQCVHVICKSFYILEIVGRDSETQLQVCTNSNYII